MFCFVFFLSKFSILLGWQKLCLDEFVGLWGCAEAHVGRGKHILKEGNSPNIFFRFYLFTFRDRGREGGREGEKHQCVVAPHTPPTGDPDCNPGMCPD